MRHTPRVPRIHRPSPATDTPRPTPRRDRRWCFATSRCGTPVGAPPRTSCSARTTSSTPTPDFIGPAALRSLVPRLQRPLPGHGGARRDRRVGPGVRGRADEHRTRRGRRASGRSAARGSSVPHRGGQAGRAMDLVCAGHERALAATGRVALAPVPTSRETAPPGNVCTDGRRMDPRPCPVDPHLPNDNRRPRPSHDPAPPACAARTIRARMPESAGKAGITGPRPRPPRGSTRRTGWWRSGNPRGDGRSGPHRGGSRSQCRPRRLRRSRSTRE